MHLYQSMRFVRNAQNGLEMVQEQRFVPQSKYLQVYMAPKEQFTNIYFTAVNEKLVGPVLHAVAIASKLYYVLPGIQISKLILLIKVDVW